MQQKSTKPTWGQVYTTLYLFGSALFLAGLFGLVPNRVKLIGLVISTTGVAIPYYIRWHNGRRNK